MESLFSSFPNISLEEWKEKLLNDLKGLGFEDLSFVDENGIKIVPFYNNENRITESNLLFQHPDWEICSLIDVVDSKEGNQKALFALNNGASGLIFQFQQEDEFDLAKLLNGIQIEYIYVSFKIKRNISDFTKQLAAFIELKNLDLKNIRVIIDYDPIAEMLTYGRAKDYNLPDYSSYITHNKQLNSITIDTTKYQNAGINITTQQALGLAHLNEYLSVFENKKVLNQIQKVNIKIAIGTDFFEEIAKMRASRILFANLFKAYNIDVALILSTESSDIYRAHLDQYNNILRDSISGLAATLGGCDNLYIHNFDQNIKEENTFSERIARNQQLIFKEESYLNSVADIASGSYYLETLTQEIANKSWQIFQEIEQKGGLIAYFESGDLIKNANHQAQQLIQQYKDGKRTLIGVNKHKNTLEEEVFIPTQITNDEGLRKINIASALSI